MTSLTVPTQHHGAHLLATEHTRFSLWAPDAKRVSVVLKTGQRLPMCPEANGWFVCEAPAPKGTRYRYRINDELDVPDPASRAQDGGIDGFSVVIDPNDYPWQHPHWKGRPWHEAVIYELHVGVLGGYAQVAKQLPRLAELGITAIELMPLAQYSGERNWGYDGALLYAPHDTYGSPQALKQLIDTAHGLGLMVIIDVVYNHFGPQGNFLPSYASAFFEEERHTPWGAGIDHGRPEVGDFFIDNALMWLLEYRADGLRLDAVHAIDNRGFLQTLATRVKQHTAPDRHVWLTVENEFNQAQLLTNDFDAQWNDDGHNILHALLTGEKEAYYADFAENSSEKLARCLSQGFIFQGQTDRRGNARGEPSDYLPASAFVLFLQNHDQIGNRALGERLHQLCPAPALHAATALLLLSPMIPLLFMGEESAAPEPFLYFTDYTGELATAVCEGRRKEFAEFTTFASNHPAEVTPDPNRRSTFDRSRPSLTPAHDDAARLNTLALYQHLLDLRHQWIIPRLQGAYSLGAQVLSAGAVAARWQMADERVLHIAVNLSDRPAPYTAPAHSELLFQSEPQLAFYLQNNHELKPYSALVSLERAHG
ncbi:malto-oligosyltrehalose trehalohydrolase [Pseudomonas sp. 7P_10.2_Bac1]|uniref:malto-oligosyltrehalose trehalohydrolase n=1 Tax=Pseudomonas sp. 7P_10.2_Bac1 TaxID=2971614 RepID=UPI0021CAC35D|nr:malto-oligosyltrehalose trehalohydrolase [Pseudomonas sp. 7P_10.2_Bac1]MCU1729735.1 malto-oligosyltrehalose trehalohydrolase [Pseudomonas sp. 7P_10.2_Bac1]